MILIKDVEIDIKEKEHSVRMKGLMDVLSLVEKDGKHFVRILVNDIGNLNRTARMYLISNNGDASNVLLKNLKYLNSVKDFNLYLHHIVPKK